MAVLIAKVGRMMRRTAEHGARMEAALSRSGALERSLPWLALAVGVFWILGLGWAGGIRAGADSADYAARAGQLLSEGWAWMYRYDYALTAHVSTLWMAWLGTTGFVLLTAALTMSLPLLADLVLRHAGAGLMFRVGALAYLGLNPELYVWAWYLLTDGFFLIQVMLCLALVTALRYRWMHRLLIPALLYQIFFTRPTGMLLLPGLAVYALLLPEAGKRRLVLGAVAAIALWGGAWMLATGGTGGLHGSITRDAFVGGHVLENIDGVYEKILDACQQLPPPTPPSLNKEGGEPPNP